MHIKVIVKLTVKKRKQLLLLNRDLVHVKNE